MSASPILPNGVRLRAFDDTESLRNSVFDSIKTTAQALEPVSNARYTLSLQDVDWADNPEYNDRDIHNARLKQQSLTRKLRGTWVLSDSQTGKPLQRAKKIIANVPYFTNQGSVIDSGNSYFIRNQQRLKYGVYTRRKENGELVTNVNTAEHHGPTHSYNYDPTNGKFNLEVGKNNIPMYTFMHAMGATDEELEEYWGKKVLEVNKAHAKDMNMRKLYDRFVRKQLHKPGDKDSDELMRERIREQAARIKFSREVNRATLGDDREDYDKRTALLATRKLIALSRDEAESDSRDNMAFQKFLGPEDLFAERLKYDDGRVRRQMLNKLTFLSRNNPDLAKVPSGLLTKQINAVITQSGLASPAEEVNPFEIYSKLFSVTRMGSGGIQSDSAIPASARQVNNSQYGFIDPLQTPESLRVGVDGYITSSAMKGSDGNLYVPVIDAKTGKRVYKNPVELANAVTTLQSEWNSRERRIAGFDADRQPRMGLKREAVQYIYPNAQDAYNDLSNLVPMLGNVKGQRVAMAARMLTQALPLEGGEAPLVQSRIPGTEESYEEKVGRRATLQSRLGGTVKRVTDNEIVMDTPEGVKKYPLLKASPSNRKTVTSHTALVKPGDVVKPGQILAKSNYTNNDGAIALGMNARAAIASWGGINTMDGMVISASFANKLKSQHAYQNRVDFSDNVKTGKKTFIGSFPSTYDKDQLDTIEDNGVVKVGTQVHKGDPLVLQAIVNSKPVDRIHRKGAASYTNGALEWDHDDPGVVTDVSVDKNGVNVVVSSLQPTRAGDKLCFFEETEILTEGGWKSCKDVTLQDRVACLEEDELVYRQPTALFSYPVGGRAYHISNANVDIEVTDNHRLYVKRRGADAFELAVPDDVYGKRVRYRKWANWTGADPEEVVLPELEYTQGNRWGGVTKKTLPEKRLTVKQYLFLLACYLTEGNLVNQSVGRGDYGIDISQTKEPNRTNMLAELNKLGIRYTVHGNGEKVRIYGKQLYEHFRQFGESAAHKFIPSRVFGWSRKSLRYLFDWMMWGDGSYTDGRPFSYHTVSSQLADDFARLCLHVGFAGNVTSEVKRTEFPEKGKVYNTRFYRVGIVSKKLEPQVNHGHTATQRVQQEYFIESRNEPVYCVEVPGHVLYARRNGKPVWISNSNRWGAKGVISAVLPDDQMPQASDGPVEIVYSPIGNIGRVNYSMVAEHLLGRIAKKTGRPVKIESFDPKNPDTMAYVLKLAKEHGIDPREALIDPSTGKPIGGIDGKGIGYGYSYVQKLHHSAEGKADERSFGRYTADGQPACLQAGSLVLTDQGLYPIEELVGVETTVFTGYRWARAVGVNMGEHQLAEIELENGTVIRCDVKHKLQDENGEWLAFEDLKIGQLVAVYKSEKT